MRFLVSILPTGKRQRSSVNGTLSNRFALECGVQQGSFLGPLLFAIYASKLFEILPSYLLRMPMTALIYICHPDHLIA